MKPLVSRRRFVISGATACAAVLTSRRGTAAAARSAEARILTDAEIGTIRPELHGHFAEHLGSCVYGGLWVGEGSAIPNVQGFRKQAVEYLRALGVPVLRWPGGCFADDYHWRDGIGPREKRPRRVNIHWGNYTEDNSFGTHEFVALCRAIGAEPYFAGNVGSGTPQELRDWVEYCNYPSGSASADERARNGSPEPFRIRYWGVGNENWGCGGQMTPEEYAGHYRRFATFIRDFGGVRPYLIACGPNGNNADWTRGFMETVRRGRRPDGFAMHFYSGGKSPATKFTVENLREQLSSFARVEKAIVEQRELLDRYDPEHRTGLLVDEWGVWDRMVPEEEKRYGRLWQQITMRSAAAAALGLNVFHRQADKLVMCNIAQIANVLHAMILTEGERCIRTPAYWAFDLAKAHRGAAAVRVETGDPSPLGLSLSASRRAETLTLTLVNPSHDTGVTAECTLSHGGAESAKARILHDPDFNSCNTFDAPDRIVPKDHPVAIAGSKLRIELPPLAVATITARLTSV